jgi:hypothetical protein
LNRSDPFTITVTRLPDGSLRAAPPQFHLIRPDEPADHSRIAKSISTQSGGKYQHE